MRKTHLMLTLVWIGAVLIPGSFALAEDITLSGTVDSGYYGTPDSIYTLGFCEVPTGNVVTLEGINIELEVGFHAKPGSLFAARYIDLAADDDSDGLMDWWENKWFGDLTRSADDDSDGDGVKAWIEYKLGSDPTANDLPGPGIHYEYDALGRITKIYRIPRG